MGVFNSSLWIRKRGLKMNRPLIKEPIYHGCPISWSEKYFQGKVKEYRKENKEFDIFLNELKEEILKRNINYCYNILEFINGNAKSNWVSPKDSLFRMLIKLYNSNKSVSQVIDYIEKCYITYQTLLNYEYEMLDEYEVFKDKSRWDSSIKDFIKLYLSNKKEYKILVKFCSLQIIESDHPYNGYPLCDSEVSIISNESIYEDALKLFDYYNGNHFNKRIINITISKLIKNNIIDKPVKIKNAYSCCLLYQIKNI